jgi:hypothetical protein
MAELWLLTGLSLVEPVSCSLRRQAASHDKASFADHAERAARSFDWYVTHLKMPIESQSIC